MKDRARLDGLLALLAGLVLVGVVTCIWVVLARTTTRGILGDLTIYREAIAYQAAGGRLYDYVYEHPTVHGLGFTYPPFAALVLQPLIWIPCDAVGGVWVASSFALVAALAFWAVRADSARRPTWLGQAPTAQQIAAATMSLTTASVLTSPFLFQLGVGQVSLFLVGCCVVDLTVIPRRWRGFLTGLAAAVKLTPLIFLPFLLLTRQRAEASRLAGAFGAACVLGFLLWPADSVDYWSTRLWQTNRVGELDSTYNKAILGTLARWSVNGTTYWWLLLGAALVYLVLRRAVLAYRDGHVAWAFLLVGNLATLLTPIAWPHHQLWAVVAAAYLVLTARPSTSLVGVLVYVVAWMFPFYVRGPQPSVWERMGWDLPMLSIVLLCLVPRIRPARGIED